MLKNKAKIPFLHYFTTIIFVFFINKINFRLKPLQNSIRNKKAFVYRVGFPAHQQRREKFISY